ncbi:MAG TPA: flotillin-like FloA family protein, partial [Thermoguttaceae bacterium]|nr:flotillin-like FloA family protein [Thermoguttaceae bacterium]
AGGMGFLAMCDMAVAAEQENLALLEENRAKVVEAEAEVPKAIAEAFHTGALGIMDYYKLRNVQADTDMRSSIARSMTAPSAAARAAAVKTGASQTTSG